MKALQQNTSQLLNIEQALGLLHDELMNRLNGIHPKEERSADLKAYYKEKITEVREQIGQCKELISQ